MNLINKIKNFLSNISKPDSVSFNLDDPYSVTLMWNI